MIRHTSQYDAFQSNSTIQSTPLIFNIKACLQPLGRATAYMKKSCIKLFMAPEGIA